MPASARCVTPARSVVIWGSFVLALCGWGGALWSYFDHGFAAGVNPGFIAALTIACTFTITCSHAVVMPDKVKLYGLGVREGLRMAREMHDDEPEPGRRMRLTAVR